VRRAQAALTRQSVCHQPGTRSQKEGPSLLDEPEQGARPAREQSRARSLQVGGEVREERLLPTGPVGGLREVRRWATKGVQLERVRRLLARVRREAAVKAQPSEKMG